MTQTLKNDPKTQGRWTKHQHQKFLQGLQNYGKDWKKIQQLIGTRNGAQIRSHAQKFFLRMKKQFDFDSSHEQIKSVEAVIVQDNTKQFLQQSQESNDYSYFVQKIVKKSHEEGKFDFWQACVDQKYCEEMHDTKTEISKRKNSFMAWDGDQLESITHVQPLKRVKTQ